MRYKTGIREQIYG
ncbi:hypothetical protein ROI_28400 [Roseburia intestinalis M50/1]|nr:hypothetical protein ROI_28400 [Roseburia intestinalis M50/1]